LGAAAAILEARTRAAIVTEGGVVLERIMGVDWREDVLEREERRDCGLRGREKRGKGKREEQVVRQASCGKLGLGL